MLEEVLFCPLVWVRAVLKGGQELGKLASEGPLRVGDPEQGAAFSLPVAFNRMTLLDQMSLPENGFLLFGRQVALPPLAGLRVIRIGLLADDAAHPA